MLAAYLGEREGGDVRDQDSVKCIGVAEDVLAEVALHLLRERVSGAKVAEQIGALGEREEEVAAPSPPWRDVVGGREGGVAAEDRAGQRRKERTRSGHSRHGELTYRIDWEAKDYRR